MPGYRTVSTTQRSGSDIQLAPGTGVTAQFERRIPALDFSGGQTASPQQQFQMPQIEMPDMSGQIAAANAQVDAEIARARQQANDTARLFQAARQEAATARDAALAETSALQTQIQSQWESHKVDTAALVGEYTETMEGAIGMMSTAAQRGAEYQMMQLTTLAATGKLGANPFAVQRQMSRAAGDVIANVMGVMGQMQAKLADGAAQLTLQGKQVNAQLFSQTMSTLAGLVGVNADIQMKHAGLVGSLYSNQAGVMVEFAKINANLAGLKISNIMDGVKIQAQMQTDFAKINAQLQMESARMSHEMTLARMKMDHDRSLQAAGMSHDMQQLMHKTSAQQMLQQMGFDQGFALEKQKFAWSQERDEATFGREKDFLKLKADLGFDLFGRLPQDVDPGKGGGTGPLLTPQERYILEGADRLRSEFSGTPDVSLF